MKYARNFEKKDTLKKGRGRSKKRGRSQKNGRKLKTG